MVEVFTNDFKYACRLLSKRPGFTALTTLVIAAGIGLSTYLFSFLDTVAYADLPFEDGESLLAISASRNGVKEGGYIDFHDFYEIRSTLVGLDEFTAYNNIDLNILGSDGARRYSAVAVDPNFFRITRTSPFIGRDFAEEDNLVGAKNVVVIGYEVWQNQFAGDPDAIQQTLRINGEYYQIIAVMPEGYLFPARAKLWIPMRQNVNKLARGSAAKVKGFARIKEGFSLRDINRDLNALMRRIEERYPETNKGIGAHVAAPLMAGAGDGAPVLYSMTVVAFLILMLASINVGNLLLSRAVERRKETAIRMALGAPKSRIVSQLLWESIIICSMGGVIGLLLIDWAMGATQIASRNFFDDVPPFWFNFSINEFTLKLFFVFLLSSILFTGLLPALKSAGGNFNSILRDGTRGAMGKKTSFLNQLLVVTEIFISMAIMISASVIVLGTYSVTRADYGANTENTLTAQVLLPDTKYNTKEKQIQFVELLQSSLENSAGTGDVMISTALPGDYSYRPAMALKGKEYNNKEGASFPRINYISITPGTLSKLGVELKYGRYFDNKDNSIDKKTVIVTDSFASRYYSNRSVLGRQLRIVEHDESGQDWLTIVGVVEHTTQGEAVIGGDLAKLPSVFRPYAQSPGSVMTVAVRMKSDRVNVTRVLRKSLQAIDPELPAFRIETYEEKIARNTDPSIFVSTIFLVFAVVAVILASSGIYAVMSNTVSQRIQEIGVKRALGAWEQRITIEFSKKSLKHLLWGGLPGLLVGCAMGFGMSKIMGINSIFLMIVSIFVTATIAAMVMIATYIPTKRAMEMEPAEALHYE